jgi:hypothetical protein
MMHPLLEQGAQQRKCFEIHHQQLVSHNIRSMKLDRASRSGEILCPQRPRAHVEIQQGV